MISKKSILISTWTFPPQANGVSHVAAAHAEGLAKLGNNVTVVTSFEPLRKVSNYNFNIVQFKIGGGARIGHEKYYGEINSYQEYISNFKGDAILFHCWASWNTELALKVFQETSAKKILVSHGVSFNLGSIFSKLAWRPYMWGFAKKARAFDHIVFLSSISDRDRFYDKYLIEKKRFTNWSVIPNGTYSEIFGSTDIDFNKKFNISKDKKIILCLAEFHPQKNQEMALRAFAKADIKDTVLVFIGQKMNDYAGWLNELADNLFHDSSRVLFFENLDRTVIISAYKVAQIFLCPSKTEVLPLILLDSMASGTPFISTDTGCIRDLPGGKIVKSEDEMVLRIQELLNNSEEYNKLKYAGISACNEIYNWRKISNDYNALINSLVN